LLLLQYIVVSVVKNSACKTFEIFSIFFNVLLLLLLLLLDDDDGGESSSR